MKSRGSLEKPDLGRGQEQDKEPPDHQSNIPGTPEFQLLLLTLYHSAQDSNNQESSFPNLSHMPIPSSKSKGFSNGNPRWLDLLPPPFRPLGLQ